ncbi:MAG: helix-hairpin-helix domain-containing protein [Opitutae bacterium]|nr:helix-hairpin-helix domain-containing protein [Opitutae bacterium]
MRLYLFILIGLSMILLNLPICASNQASSTWQVLKGCTLVSATINDGDSFKVQHKDLTFIAQLYFIDCPESNGTQMDRVRDQARYFSITEEDVIVAGKQSSSFTENFLRGEFTLITQWADAQGGKESRVFALVRKHGKLLSLELTRNGLARIYGMPPKGIWPDGVTPHFYLSQLKQHERTAQRSMTGIWRCATGSPQLAGLNLLDAHLGDTGTNKAPATINSVAITTSSRTGKLILNTASLEELKTLPGIGPALAALIIAARPIVAVDDLAEIAGITLTKIDVFRAQVLVDEPPPPPKTAAFYLADTESYLNKTITVIVSAVGQSDLTTPKSFRAVILHTANRGVPGGSIQAIIPDEFYNSFIQYYQVPGRIFTGQLYQHESDMVIVYRRK